MKDASRYYVDELFAEMLDLPTEDRDKALLGLSSDNPTLGRQLRALIAAAEPPRPTIELREALELDRYRLGERLGAGASASVWKAWDTHLHAWTALKLLHPRGPASQSALDMVMNEARAASQILSDHVVRVKAAGLLPGGPQTAGMHYIEMQLCAERRPRPDGGEELVVGSTVAGDPPHDPTEALRFIREAALGVDAAHRVGVLHRDLKPANLLLLPVSRRVLVTDFGLATPQLREPAGTDTPSTETVTVIIEGGHVVGTPAYMSPEQARGEQPTRASDVYALGATLYALLSGSAPYRPSTRHSSVPALDVIAQVREGPPRPLKADARVVRVVEKAMARQPRDRYPTALALAADRKDERSRSAPEHGLRPHRPGGEARPRAGRPRVQSLSGLDRPTALSPVSRRALVVDGAVDSTGGGRRPRGLCAGHGGGLSVGRGRGPFRELARDSRAARRIIG